MVIIPKQKEINHVGFRVLTAVILRSTIFWELTTYSTREVHRRFGGTYYSILGFDMLAYCFAYYSTLNMEVVPSSDTSAIFYRLHGVTYHKINRAVMLRSERAVCNSSVDATVRL
jgi:hypothetical protein